MIGISYNHRCKNKIRQKRVYGQGVTWQDMDWKQWLDQHVSGWGQHVSIRIVTLSSCFKLTLTTLSSAAIWMLEADFLRHWSRKGFNGKTVGVQVIWLNHSNYHTAVTLFYFKNNISSCFLGSGFISANKTSSKLTSHRNLSLCQQRFYRDPEIIMLKRCVVGLW